MLSTELSVQAKRTIFKHQNKANPSETVLSLGVAKSVVCSVRGKKNTLVCLAT